MSTRIPPARRLWIALAAIAALAFAVAPATSAAKDRNGDGIPDRWERKHHLSLTVNQAKKDQDGDALRNRGEFRAGMDPRDDDSDDDGVEDGDEGAGVISAYDPATGELTIDLFGGKQVSGLVTEDTEIECSNDDATEPDEDGSDLRRDPGEDDGDDDGGEGEGGDDEGDDSGPDHAGEDDCDGAECSVDDLAVDRIVNEAELELTADGLVFDEIELG